jgi:hypothetical protein
MTRLIDAVAFDERVRIAVGFSEEDVSEDFKDGVSTALLLLKTQPTVDAVQVVRCVQCKHFGTPKCTSDDADWFCADGERGNGEKDGNTDE